MRGKFSWPQAFKRWPGRLFSIKLPINDDLEYFSAFYITRPHRVRLLSRLLIGAPMGATRHKHQAFQSRRHEKMVYQVCLLLSLKKYFFDANRQLRPTSSVSVDGCTGKECWALLAQCTAARNLPGYRAEAKANGLRGDSPCAMGPLPATDRLEAKQLRMCLLPKWVVILRQKSKVIQRLLKCSKTSLPRPNADIP